MKKCKASSTSVTNFLPAPLSLSPSLSLSHFSLSLFYISIYHYSLFSLSLSSLSSLSVSLFIAFSFPSAVSPSHYSLSLLSPFHSSFLVSYLPLHPIFLSLYPILPFSPLYFMAPNTWLSSASIVEKNPNLL